MKAIEIAKNIFEIAIKLPQTGKIEKKTLLITEDKKTKRNF